MKKNLNFETILIYSPTGSIDKEKGKWKRYGTYLWSSYKEAQSDISGVNKEINLNNMEEYFFEFVGKDYFEKSGIPFL